MFRRDYFIVERRSVTPEGLAALNDWHDDHGLRDPTWRPGVSKRWQGKAIYVFDGKGDMLASRGFTSFRDATAARMLYDKWEKLFVLGASGPAFSAHRMFLWAVRARFESSALITLASSREPIAIVTSSYEHVLRHVRDATKKPATG